MVIEYLTLACPTHRREAFLRRDREVWTAALSKWPGFLGKEVWTSLDNPSQITLVIRWESLAQWKSFPDELRSNLDARMGDLLMSITACEAYEVAFPTAKT